jgi:hypothetical protein
MVVEPPRPALMFVRMCIGSCSFYAAYSSSSMPPMPPRGPALMEVVTFTQITPFRWGEYSRSDLVLGFVGFCLRKALSMSIKLHHDVKRRRRRRAAPLILALALLALLGWSLACWLLVLIGGA